MKYFITGGAGQLGTDLIKELKFSGESDILAPTIDELDITDEAAVEKAIANFHPDVIFHCAAWTNVDSAEENEPAATKVNVIGTKNLTAAAQKVGAKIIYISTDYVFPGSSETPYETTDSPAPISVYGKTKYAGELAVQAYKKSFIVRTAWVFGKNGRNFPYTILKLSETRPEISVVNDQIGSPTYTVDLSKFLVDLASGEKYGLYHATNEGFCSWAEFATYVLKVAGRSTKILPVSTEEYEKNLGRPEATRPKFSKLSKKSITENGFSPLPAWQSAVDRFIKEINL